MKTTTSETYTFAKVKHDQNVRAAMDAKGRKIRGLWRRGDYFYGQVTIPEAGGRRTTKRALGQFTNVADAFLALEALRAEIREGNLQMNPPALTFQADAALPAPPEQCFSWLSLRYLDYTTTVGIKKPASIQKEKYFITSLNKRIGQLPISRLCPRVFEASLHDLIATNAQGVRKMGPRSANHELLVARAISAYAQKIGVVRNDFTLGVKFLPYNKREFPLVEAEKIRKFCAAVHAHLTPKVAQHLVDFIQFLSFTGARRNESLAMRWEDIDWNNEQVVFGTRGDTKNGRERFLDFNAPLKEHLLTMKARREELPEELRSRYLFPSTVNHNVPSRGMAQNVIRVTAASGVKLGGFHNLRRYFASWCVMQKVDYMTIARWLGHSDGGLLLTKTYARLSSPHTKQMAATLQRDASLVF